jgi:molecular chaperone GrpE
MSEDKKKSEETGEQKAREEETADVVNSNSGDTQEHDTAQDGTQTPEGVETTGPEEPEKPEEPPKSEKTYTLTQEQMEAAELAAKQLVSVKDQFIRLTAEYDNYRKRTAKEKENIYQDAKIDTIQEFLAVYDNLERAVSSEGGEDSPHKKGLEMIFQQYQGILEKLGVTKMDDVGKPFDPARHNAVMHVEDDALGENVVSDIFQAGFMMGDRVLRFATVRVAN